jgi:uncharacterized protein (TIGR00369 family)
VFDLASEPLRGTIGDPGWLALPGLEAMGMSVRGETAPPPIHHLMGLRPTEAGLGRATFTLPITKWLEDGLGIIEAGVFPIVADAALSTALYTGMPPGRMVSTTVLHLLYVRPITRQATHINARAQAEHVGREVGVSECRIEDQHGRLLAFGTTRCVFRDIEYDPDARPMPPPEPITDPPDPYLRPVPPDAFWTRSAIDGLLNIEIQREVIAGNLANGPRFDLTGMFPRSIEEGVFGGIVSASPWLSAGTPFMYGGMLAWICDGALTAAMWSTLAPGEALATLDMEVRFLRPVLLDGSTLDASSKVVHGGRSIRVAEATLTGADGKTVAIATGSGMVLPGGLTAFFRGRPPEEIVGA